MKHNDTGCRERGYRHRKTEHTHMHKNNDKKRGTDREKVIRKDRKIAQIEKQCATQSYTDSTNRERK